MPMIVLFAKFCVCGNESDTIWWVQHAFKERFPRLAEIGVTFTKDQEKCLQESIDKCGHPLSSCTLQAPFNVRSAFQSTDRS